MFTRYINWVYYKYDNENFIKTRSIIIRDIWQMFAKCQIHFVEHLSILEQVYEMLNYVKRLIYMSVDRVR